MKRIGWSGQPRDATAGLASLARNAGASGVVCSPDEAATVRQLWSQAFIVTPGIRPEGAERGDQARVATPAAAIRAGADLLVVGRPVLEASDPVAAAAAIHAEIAEALRGTLL
jgi:orotidine-5'-phosphate decarboxylase